MLFSTSLKKNDDFRKVYRKGRAASDDLVSVHIFRNGTGGNRLGVSISKKKGNSVVRHSFKRRIMEIYRLHEEMFNSGLDIIVVARGNMKELYKNKSYYHMLEESFLTLAKKLRAMNL